VRLDSLFGSLGGHNIGPGAAELKAVKVLSFERELLISADPKRSGADQGSGGSHHPSRHRLCR
jgi:hypothetical protein